MGKGSYSMSAEFQIHTIKKSGDLISNNVSLLNTNELCIL